MFNTINSIEHLSTESDVEGEKKSAVKGESLDLKHDESAVKDESPDLKHNTRVQLRVNTWI